MAWLRIFFSTWICKIMQFIMSGSIFIPTTLYPRREKTFWSELESNPGPLASQATTLTTRPWLLGQRSSKVQPLAGLGFLKRNLPCLWRQTRTWLICKNISKQLRKEKYVSIWETDFPKIANSFFFWCLHWIFFRHFHFLHFHLQYSSRHRTKGGEQKWSKNQILDLIRIGHGKLAWPAKW